MSLFILLIFLNSVGPVSTVGAFDFFVGGKNLILGRFFSLLGFLVLIVVIIGAFGCRCSGTRRPAGLQSDDERDEDQGGSSHGWRRKWSARKQVALTDEVFLWKHHTASPLRATGPAPTGEKNSAQKATVSVLQLEL